jgi:undecaprenyl diphosphate synthase
MITKDMDEKLARTAARLGLRPEQLPRNIAIIMDGNGRWAQARNRPRYEGHGQGAKTAEAVALTCVDLGMESVTLYSFSTENWKRPKIEVDALMHLYAEYIVRIRATLMRNNVKLLHLGRMEGLPTAVVDALTGSMDMTKSNTGMIMALAINYSGRVEIADAAKAVAKDCREGRLRAEDIDEKCFAQHLYTPEIPDPDLLIRTAGELRVSNFLLWQICYSEFYVTDTLWPDFNDKSIDDAILAYASRDRRFGGLDPNPPAKKKPCSSTD